MTHVTVVATLVARKGQEKAVEAILLGLLEPSRKDEGCIRYDLHRGLDDPGCFVFYETWASRELLEKHLQTPHLTTLGREAFPLLESKDVKVMEKIG